MPRFEPIDTGMKFLPIDLSVQLLPGTFEHALSHLIDRELDLHIVEAHFNNDACAIQIEPRCARWCSSPGSCAKPNPTPRE